MIGLDYKQALDYLSRSYSQKADTTLTRIKTVLKYLGSPQNRLSVIHVAGTNGKGSACAFISSMLTAAGYTVGVFTSPHLIRCNERITVNAQSISDETFAAELTAVSQASERVGVTGLNFFEILTAMAFNHFARRQVDFAVIETGLGGRLDMTNVVKQPLLSVITAIGFDHMELLGSTLEAIANEKAGIIKENCPVAIYPTTMLAVFKQAAAAKNAPLFCLGNDIHFFDVQYTLEGTIVSIHTAYFDYHSLTIPLLGEHQLYNAAYAIECIHMLQRLGVRISELSIREGLRNTRWPGRFTLIPGSPVIVLDGAHNTDGASCFHAAMERYFNGVYTVLLTGILRSKFSHEMLNHLSAQADQVVCTEPPTPNAMSATVLAGHMAGRHGSALAEPDWSKALETALSIAGPNGVVAISGSLYLVGAVLKQKKWIL